MYAFMPNNLSQLVRTISSYKFISDNKSIYNFKEKKKMHILHNKDLSFASGEQV